jgi:NitT/TauT family transport system substrate-binding protein
MTNKFNRRTFLGSTAAMVSTLAMPSIVRATTPIKMVLNWRYQGPQSWFFLAQDKGYFADAGIEVVMDQGSGSGAAVGKVAGGAYDVGFGDINALIRLAAQKPEEAPIGVYQMYNKPPFTVAVLSSSDIKTAKDLEGRKLGGSASDGALKLFPAFANVAGIDTSGIETLNFKPNLREQMLKSEQVEGVFGYVNTIRFSAKLSGMDPDKDIRFISYGDYGMDLYSNGLIASKKLVAERPEAVKGLITAINKGVADTLADMDAAPELATIGLGGVDSVRFKKAIDIVVEANGLERTPDMSEIFTDQFLPAADQKIFKLL